MKIIHNVNRKIRNFIDANAFSDALAFCDELMVMGSSTDDIKVYKAYSLQRLNRADEANEYIESIHYKALSDFHAFRCFCYVYREAYGLAESIEMCEWYARNNTDDHNAWRLLASRYAQLGEYRSAYKYYHKALSVK